MGDKTNILFVCRYNRFRSRVAEAYFNKINNNPKINAKSAGLMKGRPLNPETIKESKKFGLDIKGEVKGLSSSLLSWQDITVLVADDVPPEVFRKGKEYKNKEKKIIEWKIKDSDYRDKENVRKVIKKIMLKVDKLNKKLENG